MSSSDANKSLEVVSYVEALFIFIIFAAVLFVLYPKDMLQKQVISESSNYDLTAIYLQNMLRLEPENRTLTLALLKSSLKSGKYDLALKMIELLKSNADETLKKELTKYRFEALKVKYFSTNEARFHVEIRTEMSLLFNSVIAERSYLNEELEYWYKGSREFSLHQSALFFLYRLLEREERTQWLEECFYLSSDLKDEKMQGECLSKLRKLDEHEYEKWTQQAYYIALGAGETERAVGLLKDMALRSKKWHLELAKYYLELKRYKASSDEYMLLYKSAKVYKEKTGYFMKALEALQYGSLMEEAADLARRYEALYYKDKKMSRRLIKLYLAAGKLDDAKRVSIERLKYLE